MMIEGIGFVVTPYLYGVPSVEVEYTALE